MNWRDLVQCGNFSVAESGMLAETVRGEGFFTLNEVRARFHEGWGDRLDGDDQIGKYEKALINWQQFAFYATSGGEGTVRMIDLDRMRRKIENLKKEQL